MGLESMIYCPSGNIIAGMVYCEVGVGSGFAGTLKGQSVVILWKHDSILRTQSSLNIWVFDPFCFVVNTFEVESKAS